MELNLLLSKAQARNVLIKLKKAYGFTYKDLAEILECSACHLSRIASGEKELSRKIISKLENFLIENNIEYL